jgi:hypothetical protein
MNAKFKLLVSMMDMGAKDINIDQGSRMTWITFKSDLSFADIAIEFQEMLDLTGYELLSLTRMAAGWSANLVYNPEATAQLQAVTA